MTTPPLAGRVHPGDTHDRLGVVVMVPLVVATKLHAPRARRGLVLRPRLTAQLRRGAEVGLTLVSAPAGFGKTTLLTDWLGATPETSRCVAWLSLDAADNHPATFWSYVAAALEGVVPNVSSAAAELLDSTAPPLDLVVTTLLNELAASPREVWLVLDDYHLVDGREIGQGMAFLLEHLPPNSHVVLSTRADPDLPLARWRARGELVEIRAADLRFTAQETAAYLTGAVGHQLAAEETKLLEERTEGWIAALQLAALSLRGRPDVSGFITRFAGDDRYIVDYLVEEVLTQQPDAVRTFLLQTAVLDRLTGPLCDAVTGRHDSREVILGLERANLFVVALDDQREWYRYHHLFADMLQAHLLSEQPAQVPVLHQRASEWYERHDLTEEAVGHALAAQDHDRAAHLVELAVSTIRRHRQETTMHGWLHALPADTVRRSPVLSLFYGSMLMAAGDLNGVEPWLDDAERVLAAGPGAAALPWADTVDLVTVPSTIAMYRAALAQARGDTAGTAAHAQHAWELAGPDNHLARGGAAGFLGFAAWATGDVTAALATFSEAVSSLHAAGNLVDELGGAVVLADLWLAAGRPSEAREVCVQALGVAEAHGSAVRRATAELHVALSEIDLEAGDLDHARRHLGAASERAAMNESRHRWFTASALLARAHGDLQEAVQLLDQAEHLYRPGFFPDVRPIAAVRARTWIAQGKLAEADHWARRQGLSADDEARYLSEFDHLTLVRLLLARHRADRTSDALDQVAKLLDRLETAADTDRRAGSQLEIRLLQALVQDSQGRRQQALTTLAQGLELAPEPASHFRLFADEGAPLMELLADAGSDGVMGNLKRRLLPVSNQTRARRPASGHQAPPPGGSLLSDRELEVLRLLDTELTGPGIARELFVTHNTVRTHLKHIFTKLDVTSRRAAVLRGREHGLI